MHNSLDMSVKLPSYMYTMHWKQKGWKHMEGVCKRNVKETMILNICICPTFCTFVNAKNFLLGKLNCIQNKVKFSFW